MAWTVQLTDGTTTFDCNDLSNTWVNENGFQCPPPTSRTSYTGDNLFRHGSDLISLAYNNRTVQINFQVLGSSTDNLATRIQSVHTLLRKAKEFSTVGVGNQVQVKFQWNSATNPVYFNVLQGDLDLGPTMMGVFLQKHTRLRDARLIVECEPFAQGTEESLENYLDDPGFECSTGTLFADWTVANGTRAVEASGAPEGAVWGKITLNTSSSVFQCSQVQTMTGGVHIFSLTYKINGGEEYEIFLTDSGGTTVTALTPDNTQRTATVTRDSSSHTSITAGIRAASGTDTDDIVLMDLAYLGDGSTAPTAWVSSRNVYNNNEDGGKIQQSKLNFIDIENIPGDAPCPLQIKATEAEGHTDFWCGARHATRQRDVVIWHEGEDFATFSDEPTDLSPSSGNIGEMINGTIFDAQSGGVATSTTSITLSHTVGTAQGSRLLVVGVATKDTSTSGPSGITYAGDALTKIDTSTKDNASATIFYMVNPDTGSNNIVVSFASTIDEIAVRASSYYGVDAVNPRRSNATADGASGTTPSVAVTTVAGDIVIDMVSSDTSNSRAWTPGAGQVDLGENSAPESTASYEIATSTTTTMTHSPDGSASWCQVAAAFRSAMFGATAASPTVVTKDVTTPPEGLYRVLARVAAPDAGDQFGMSIGYAYGGVTKDPAVAADYTTINVATGHIIDIGTLTVPPVATPGGGTVGTLTLRLAMYPKSGPSYTDRVWFDWVMLMPVDNGFAYLNKTLATNIVWADSRSNPKGLYIMNSADVIQSFPADQVGRPPEAHPEGTRVYFVSDDGAADIADKWTIGITYLPKFLQVAEA